MLRHSALTRRDSFIGEVILLRFVALSLASNALHGARRRQDNAGMRAFSLASATFHK